LWKEEQDRGRGGGGGRSRERGGGGLMVCLGGGGGGVKFVNWYVFRVLKSRMITGRIITVAFTVPSREVWQEPFASPILCYSFCYYEMVKMSLNNNELFWDWYLSGMKWIWATPTKLILEVVLKIPDNHPLNMGGFPTFLIVCLSTRVSLSALCLEQQQAQHFL